MQMEEISSLIEAHGTAVYRFCCKLAGNSADADDLYQETFLIALEQCHKIDAARNPKAFLLSVAVKRWKSSRRTFARRQRLAPTVPLLEGEGAAAAQNLELSLAQQEALETVRQVAGELSDRYRIPIYLYYTVELDISEISQVMKIPAGTVKSRLHKARSMMKKRLEELQYEMPEFI